MQRLADALPCLLWNPRCGIDIRRFQPRVRDWFAGGPVPEASTLPPASYPVLWPLLGWLPLEPALWLWAITSLGGLAWLGVIAVRESGARTPPERLLMALLPFSMYAARATIVNGQFILHVLPPLLAALLMANRQAPTWRRDLGVAALLLVALVKPSVSAPFVLLLALAGEGAPRLRPLALLGAGYAGLTLVAAAFRGPGPIALWWTWVSNSVRVAAEQSGRSGAYGSLHDWLGAAGLERGNTLATLLLLAALGLFLHRYRRADIWILLGVTAVAARLWTYHRLYDDMLILLPMVALFRLVARPAPDRPAAIALGLLWAGAVAPARLFFLPPPGAALFMAALQIGWLVALVVLARAARRHPGARFTPIR